MKDTQVGTLIDSNAQRDAIHCAITPVQMADDTCQPGTHVGLLDNGMVSQEASKLIGIVDPFLKKPVRKGEWCWLRPSPV